MPLTFALSMRGLFIPFLPLTPARLLPMATVAYVDPPKRWPVPNIRELWRARELLFYLVWRIIKVRYRQTAVGVGWALVQPLLTMIVFTLIFSKVANVGSAGVPYPLFVLAGLLPWNYFASSVTVTSQSIVSNVPLITKVFFPRILLPLSSTIAPLVDLLSSLVLLVVVMAFYRTPLRLTMLLVPLLLLAVVTTALSISLWLSAINVRYRDVTFVVPFLVQLWLFLTPVVYPGALVPEGPLRVLYALNPMVGVVEGFRWALFGTAIDTALVLPSALMVLFLLAAGTIYFLKTEQFFADVI